MLAFGNPVLTGESASGARSAAGSLSALASSCRQDGPAAGDLLRALAPLPETEDELKIKIAQKNQEIQKLEEEIKNYQNGIKETSKNTQTLQNAINRLNQEIKNLNYELSLTQIKISKK